MRLEDVQAVLSTDPFVPLTLIRTDGTKVQIPYQHVAITMPDGLLVFKGVPGPGIRRATGKDFIAFDRIDRIEPKRPLRKKKSSR